MENQDKYITSDDEQFIAEQVSIVNRYKELQAIENIVNKKISSTNFPKSGKWLGRSLFVLLGLILVSVLIYFTQSNSDSANQHTQEITQEASELTIENEPLEDNISIAPEEDAPEINKEHSKRQKADLRRSVIEETRIYVSQVEGIEIEYESPENKEIPVFILHFDRNDTDIRIIRELLVNSLINHNYKIVLGTLEIYTLTIKAEKDLGMPAEHKLIFTGKFDNDSRKLEIDLLISNSDEVEILREVYDDFKLFLMTFLEKFYEIG